MDTLNNEQRRFFLKPMIRFVHWEKVKDLEKFTNNIALTPVDVKYDREKNKYLFNIPQISHEMDN